MSIYLPKTVSAFVGSDIVCSCLSATDYLRENKSTLVVDIGTNGEMVLFSDNKIYCCSTAAGPAFEGVGIYMGMSASKGAVSGIRLNGENIEYDVIGGGKAIGICGSGLIDAVSIFLKLKAIDETGCIDEIQAKNYDLLVELPDDIALKIGDSGVYITQKDIRNLQLAKSAVCAGVQTLLRECNINPEYLSKLLIAGGFGNGIDFDNAGAIGLIPKELCLKAQFVGNAALCGASDVLLSEDALKKSLDIAENAKLVELSNSEFFGEKYIENMMF